MKIVLITTAVCLMGFLSQAQTTTNVFPSTGNAGVGTTLPSTAFHVYNNTTALSPSNFITIENRGNNAAYTTTHVVGGMLFAGFRDVRASANIAGIWSVRTTATVNNNLNSYGDLVFGTNNSVATNLQNDNALPTERMRILANGNVGIGLSAPTLPLSVLGSAQFSAVNDQTKAYTRISWNGVPGTGASTFDNHRDLGNAAFVFRTTTGTDPLTEVMRISGSGNMGIGSINPTNKLQVADGADDAGTYGSVQIIRPTNPGDNRFHLSFIRNGQMVSGIGYVSGTNTLGIWAGVNTQPAPLIAFLQNQSVGIGTTDTKGYMLAVAGSTIATKVAVKQQANWPDYVFEPTYNLPSLHSVENFINVNKHLPDVPSAEIINKDGIDLGNNQTVLLKKIEELTLYLIEQNKKIEARDTLIKKLTEEQQKLQEQNNTLMLLIKK